MESEGIQALSPGLDSPGAAPRRDNPYGRDLARVEQDYPDFSIYGTRSGLYGARARNAGKLVGPVLTADSLDGLAGKMDAAREPRDRG